MLMNFDFDFYTRSTQLAENCKNKSSDRSSHGRPHCHCHCHTVTVVCGLWSVNWSVVCVACVLCAVWLCGTGKLIYKI